MTTKYFYDANGNNVRVIKPGEVKKMKYDELNRMVRWTDGTKTEKTKYRGAEWHRASQTANGVTTAYLYDGDNVVADVIAGNIQSAYVTPFLDQNLSMITGGQIYYYSQDGLGSVRTLTDNTGIVKNKYAYTAYGETFTPNTTETIANRYQYTGREKNAVSGLQYNRWRFYNSRIGRWTARDPAGYPNNIQGNLYDYVGGSPLLWIDSFGLAGHGTPPSFPKTPSEWARKTGPNRVGQILNRLKNTIKRYLNANANRDKGHYEKAKGLCTALKRGIEGLLGQPLNVQGQYSGLKPLMDSLLKACDDLPPPCPPRVEVPDPPELGAREVFIIALLLLLSQADSPAPGPADALAIAGIGAIVPPPPSMPAPPKLPEKEVDINDYRLTEKEDGGVMVESRPNSLREAEASGVDVISGPRPQWRRVKK